MVNFVLKTYFILFPQTMKLDKILGPGRTLAVMVSDHAEIAVLTEQRKRFRIARQQSIVNKVFCSNFVSHLY